MQIELAYGKGVLLVDIPDRNLVHVFSMNNPAPISDTYIEITKSLLRPIGMNRTFFDMAKGRSSACILICDKTRPVPNKLILEPMLKTLHAAGLKHEDIIILIATGIHRPNSDEEIIELVGKKIAEKYRIENHIGLDKDAHRHLGQTNRGTDVWIDKRFMEADLKIATGFIEPHMIAGFSGGRKMVVPGIASYDTMKQMHSARLMEHPNVREGVIEGNPFHEEALEIARMSGLDFIVNVALNEKKEICGIFSGDFELAHHAGIEFVRKSVTDSIPEPVDIIVTSSAGYPLDATFYQCIKGMAGAVPVVKHGGTIIIASECSEGIGGLEFSRLLKETTDINLFLNNIFSENYFELDQWQMQKYALAINQAQIILVSDGLNAKQKKDTHLLTANSVEEAVKIALQHQGPDAKIAVNPWGPYIIATI